MNTIHSVFNRINYKVRRVIKLMRDKPYWNKLRDKHKNLPGFVIGNGPSLKMDDLTKISDCKMIEGKSKDANFTLLC